MHSGFSPALVLISIVFIFGACSKDQDSPKAGGALLFNHRLQVIQGEDYSVGSEGDAIPTGIASNTNNTLWVCGNIVSKTAPTRAIVRQSMSYGDKGSWTNPLTLPGPLMKGQATRLLPVTLAETFMWRRVIRRENFLRLQYFIPLTVDSPGKTQTTKRLI